jgi:hypothetical protein
MKKEWDSKNEEIHDCFFALLNCSDKQVCGAVDMCVHALTSATASRLGRIVPGERPAVSIE